MSSPTTRASGPGVPNSIGRLPVSHRTDTQYEPSLSLDTVTDFTAYPSGISRCRTSLTSPILGRRMRSPCSETVPFWLFVVYESLHLPFFLKAGGPAFLPFLFPLRESHHAFLAASKFLLAFARASESASRRKGLSSLRAETSPLPSCTRRCRTRRTGCRRTARSRSTGRDTPAAPRPASACTCMRFVRYPFLILFLTLSLDVPVQRVEGHVSHRRQVIARRPERVAPQLLLYLLRELLPEHPGSVCLKKVYVCGEDRARPRRYKQVDVVVPALLPDDIDALRRGDEQGELLEPLPDALVREAVPAVLHAQDEVISQRVYRVARSLKFFHIFSYFV